jgi:hypothetical protein
VKRDEIGIVNNLRRERVPAGNRRLARKTAPLQRSTGEGMSPRELEEHEEQKTRIAMLEARMQKTNRKLTFIWG